MLIFSAKRKIKGLSSISCFVLSVSDIVGRKFVTALTVIAVAMAIMVSLLLRGYGYQIYHAQEQMVNQEVPTVMTISCTDPTNLSQRLTDEKLEQLKNDLRVDMAYPKIEINVSLKHEEKTIDIPVEGILPEDPRLEQNLMYWSKSSCILGAEGLVVSRRLFEKIGGLFVSGSPIPNTFTVCVARTQEGKKQEDTLVMPIVAITKQTNDDCMYVPLHVAERLDLFCSHKASGLANDMVEGINYPSAVAYVPETELGRIQDEAKNLNITAHEIDRMEYPDNERSIWVPIDNSVQINGLEHGDIYYNQSFSFEIDGKQFLLAGLAYDDPRWKEYDDPAVTPKDNKIYSVTKKAANLSSFVHDGFSYQIYHSNSKRRFPVNADLVCSLETIKRVSFTTETCSLNHSGVFVCTNTAKDAFNLQQNLSVKFQADNNGFAWSIFNIAETLSQNKNISSVNENLSTCISISEEMHDQQLNTNTCVEDSAYSSINCVCSEKSQHSESKARKLCQSIERECPLIEIKQVLGGYALVEDDKYDELTLNVMVRFLPNEIFEQLAQVNPTHSLRKKKFFDRSLDAITVGNKWYDRPSNLKVSGSSVRVINHLNGWKDGLHEIWLNADCHEHIEHTPATTAVILFGNWDDCCKASDILSKEENIEQAYAGSYPRNFAFLFEGHRKTEIQNLVDATCQDSHCAEIYYFSDQGRYIAKTDTCLTDAEKKLFQQFYNQFELLDSARYSQRLYSSALKAGLVKFQGNQDKTIRFDSAYEYYQAKQYIITEGELKLFEALSVVPLRSYAIKDASRTDGYVDDQLLATMSMTKPTFFKVEPKLAIETQYMNNNITVDGYEPYSIKRFQMPVLSGNWPQKQNEVMLSSGFYGNLNDAKNIIGEHIKLAFFRGDRASFGNQLILSFKVVGVYHGTSNSSIIANGQMVKNIHLWESHKVLWNTDEGCFEIPEEIYDRQGHVRATVIACDAKDLEELTTKFDNEGYRSESKLHQLEGLRQLSRLLKGTTIAFSLGLLLIATFSIFVSGYSQIRTKSWEIALYKSLGCRTSEVLRVFLFEGIIIGILAFILGALSAIIIEPLVLRQVLTQIMHLNFDDIIEGTIAIPWEAFPVALLVTLFFVLIGVLIPSWAACNCEQLAVALKRSE